MKTPLPSGPGERPAALPPSSAGVVTGGVRPPKSVDGPLIASARLLRAGDARERRAGAVRQPERDGDGTARAAARGQQLAHQACELRRSLRHGVRARHGQAELGSARDVAERAAERLRLRARDVIRTGRARRRRRLAGIHVVVTPGAGGRRRLREVVAGGGTLAWHTAQLRMSCGKPTPVTVVPVQVPFGQSPSLLHGTPSSAPPAQALTFSAKTVPPDARSSHRALHRRRSAAPSRDGCGGSSAAARSSSRSRVEALVGVAELAEADLSPAAAMLGQRLVAAVALRRWWSPGAPS